ncbi:MAG: succinylglutamate desuccinylase/aspartoacylase family protein [Myxococcota bacterium]|nr:succinylglutamate desuccinylase/aspartoacylase family protein [Myxococcota bacterium]
MRSTALRSTLVWLALALSLGFAGAPAFAQSPQVPVRSTTWDQVELLGQRVAPGERARLMLRVSESFAGFSVDTPVLVLRGRVPGKTICMVAGIHGDELNGIEVVRNLFEDIDPQEVAGMLLGVPVANLHGFRRSSRYLPDRRDLNRAFPGRNDGSAASRIASALFESVVSRCDAMIDFHTGSFHRTNVPQIRADLREREVAQLARAFGVATVVHKVGGPGTLRGAAVAARIPTITYEAGEPMRFQRDEIARGVEGARNVLVYLGALEGREPRGPAETFYRSAWVRVNDGGIYLPTVELGDAVELGDLLGTITDFISNERSEVRSPWKGRVIGMALPQVVIPGFAAFHVGIEGVAEPPPVPMPGTQPGLPSPLLDPEDHPG